MQHVYRQVTGHRRYTCQVLAQERRNAELFPFDRVLLLPAPRTGIFERGWRKYIRRDPPLVYRGHYEALLQLLTAHPADLMHVYFGHAGVHLLPFIERWNKPAVVSFHGVDAMPRPRERNYDTGMRRLLQTVPIVLARSESLGQALVGWGCPAEKIRINRTSVPLDAFPYVPRQFPGDGKWRLVQACRFIPKKGLDTTLRAFALFMRKFPLARLTLVGDGPLEEDLRRLAAELGVARAVDFVAFQAPQGLAATLHDHHVFLHPSRKTKAGDQEGVPNAMLEAMATGMPVVATIHGGIPEVVEHKVSGLLGAEDDLDAIANCLVELAESRQLFEETGARAAAEVRENFSAGRQIERLEGFYDEAVEIFQRQNPVSPTTG